MLYLPGEERRIASSEGVLTKHDSGGFDGPSVTNLGPLISALPSAVAVLNRIGEIVAVSDAWRRFECADPQVGLVPCSPSENYLDRCGRASGPCSHEAHEVAAGIQALLAGEVPLFTFEYRCTLPDQQRWVLLQASPLHEDGLGAVVQLNDVTACRLAAEAAHRLERFVAMASHEFRTPLTVIKSYLSGAERQIASCTRDASKSGDDAHVLTDIEQAIRNARCASSQLSGLLEALLQVSRARAGKLVVHPQQCDLGALVRQTVQQQRQIQPGRPLRLHLQPTRPLVVSADPVYIRQVLTNLLDNACKYSPEGCPVDVMVKVASGRVTVSIRDRGPGLPEQEQADIWECFYQAADVQREPRESAGLGLGLYVTRLIVEQHMGQVGVKSTPGSGSTFWFQLPLGARGRDQVSTDDSEAGARARAGRTAETLSTRRRPQAAALTTVH